MLFSRLIPKAPYKTIRLGAVTETADGSAVRAVYERHYGKERGPGTYTKDDWSRINHVFGLVGSGDRILDVGVGAGQFINLLSTSGSFSEVHGVDVTTHSKFIELNESFQVHKMSITALDFPDQHFETIVCMEVLEHLEKEDFLKGLLELRRTCRGRLIMSVPFKEPLPLPKYHKLRFDQEDLKVYFPRAKIFLLKKSHGQVPWALLIEDNPSRS